MSSFHNITWIKFHGIEISFKITTSTAINREMLSNRKLLNQIRLSVIIWNQLKDSPHPADRLLKNFFHENRKKIGSRDRRFIAETIHAVFRHKLFLETWIEELNIQESDLGLVLFALAREGILNGGPWQTAVSDTLQPHFNTKEIGGNLSRGKLPQSKLHEPLDIGLSLSHSFPLWLVRKWLHKFGSGETQKLLFSMQTRPPLVIRTNPLKISRDELTNMFLKLGFKVGKTSLSSLGIVFEKRENLLDSNYFKEGLFEIQDEGSQFLCERIGATKDEIVWDVCSGSGGKSLALAGWMENTGRIFVSDIRPTILRNLMKRAKRSGVTTLIPLELNKLSSSDLLKGGVDRILVDAPCSGTGTLRRNPDRKWKLKENSFSQHHKLQLEVIQKSLLYLKTGGLLHYITCSLEQEENDDVAHALLSSSNNTLKWHGKTDTADSCTRLVPHRDQTDGFFMATFKKTS